MEEASALFSQPTNLNKFRDKTLNCFTSSLCPSESVALGFPSLGSLNAFDSFDYDFIPF